jgi:DNA-cytosine methyltransferase
MNVLSLFDGMSCGQLALQRVGIRVDNYYASEIDKYAISVCLKNFPQTIHVGDVTKWREWDIDWSSIDLVIGGSPCQSFSRSGDGSGFDGKSRLFFDYNDIKNNVLKHNPNAYFLLENVEMKRDWEDTITKYMEVFPLHIDSKLVSAQKRQRVYWTNIPNVTIPDDKNIRIQDILIPESGQDVSSSPVVISSAEGMYMIRNATKLGYQYALENFCVNLEVPTSKTRRGRVSIEKTNTLNTACNYAVVENGVLRSLSITEYERLQTLPDGYTCGVSDSQRKKMIGNGWTVDVIAHIFKNLIDEKDKQNYRKEEISRSVDME